MVEVFYRLLVVILEAFTDTQVHTTPLTPLLRLTWWLLYFDFGTVLLHPHPYVLAKVVCSTHNALSLLPTRVERREMVTDEARPRTGAFVRIELSSLVVIILRASSPIRHILVHVVRLELCRQVHERLKPVFRHSEQ